ncbi:DKNYY domain-containing protein [Fodinibius salsisoli]|uniref:DKNYY domain-containing protein n=1 Tax=Fodinibius salsisoli TaxID=2820877 RepID=A0ABT3PM53_9BACT|nr:DKNYY domain-containing protein [Fodinibius salsisoli]MCW9707029.1 DKNYY domain-containing protein [Fodinibius salsisoli]
MNWIVLIALFAWPLIWISSVMMFGGPGASNEISTYISVIVVLSYPIAIFGLYWLFDRSFFGIAGRQMFLVSLIVVPTLLYMSGYLQDAWNLSQGIRNEGYSNVQETVYFNGQELKEADSESFEILRMALPAIRTTPYAKDNEHVYYDGAKLENAEASTFEALSQSTGSIYFKDQHNVFYAEDLYQKPAVVEGADPASIELIREEHSDYWRDNEKVFYAGKEIVGADPVSFKLAPRADNHYWQDNSSVYFNGKPLAHADPENFSSFKKEPYHFTRSLGQDNDGYVYWRGRLLPGADASSFKVLNHEIGMDDDHLFRQTEVMLTDYDASSFRLLEDDAYLGKDVNHVYNLSKGHAGIIEGVDPNTFAVLGKGYLKDHQYVYYRKDYESKVVVVEEADASSFVIATDVKGKADARDTDRYFHQGKPLPASTD